MNATSPDLAPTSPGEVPKTHSTTSPHAPFLKGRGGRGGMGAIEKTKRPRLIGARSNPQNRKGPNMSTTEPDLDELLVAFRVGIARLEGCDCEPTATTDDQDHVRLVHAEGCLLEWSNPPRSNGTAPRPRERRL